MPETSAHPAHPAAGAATPGLKTARPIEASDEPAAPIQLASGMSLRQAAPSWLISMAVHAALVMLLAWWYLPPQVLPPLSLLAHLMEAETQALEEKLLDAPIEPEQLAEQSLDDIVIADVEATADAPLDMSSLNELAIDTSRGELLPFGAEVGLLDSLSAASLTAGGFDGRSLEGRAMLVRRAGGNAQSEKAVEESLDWLARHQLPDGSWSFDHRYGECQGQCDQPGNLVNGVRGATGLALLPFLGAGHTTREGKHERVVARGISALVNMIELKREGGSLFDGGQMYSQGIASMALCEAFAMTHDRRLRAPAQSALLFIANAQDAKGGGWRYTPGQRGDTSVMGWQVGALKSGYLAGLEVPPIVPDRASYFLDTVALDGGEAYAYEQDKMENHPATSAIGLLCRMYLGAEHDHPVLKRGVEQLAKRGPSKADAYYNYYATQVVFQFTSGKGEMWDNWNKSMRDMLVAGRETKGHAAGSWAPKDGDHGKAKGGRLYTTALNCMTLEVYYRLLPIYQSKAFEEGFQEEGEDK